MLNVLYLLLAFIAIGITVFYAWFYEVSIPGAQYHYTYAGIALTAAVIFAALWFAGRINKDNGTGKILVE